MEELKCLYSSRRGYRTHLKKLLARTDEITKHHRNNPTEPPRYDVATLSDLRDQLRRKYDIISKLDTQIVALMRDEEELATDVCEAEEINESLSSNIAKITQLLGIHETLATTKHVQQNSPLFNTGTPLQPLASADSNPEVQDENPDVEQNSTTNEAPQLVHNTPVIPTSRIVTGNQDITRLPKLNIPTFSRNTLQWQSFWDCFEAAVHHNPSITGVQKLNYLWAQLQGSALQVIAGLPLTNTNYNHSVTLLKERYGEPHKLVDAHMQALIELNCPTNTLASLQLFYDSVEDHTRSLQSLGTLQESYRSMLVPIILRKLSAEIRRNIARAHGSDQWTLNELQSAILQKIRILEMGSEYSNYQSNLPTPTASFLTNTNRWPQQPNSENQKRSSTCVYCGRSHTPTNCESVKDKQKHMEIIKRDMLCFSCLGRHKVSQCRSRHRCRQCNRRHHTSVCNDTAPADSSDPAISNKDKDTTNKQTPNTTILTTLTTDSSPTPFNNTMCLLKTAVATVTSLNSETEVNILFDEGSQRSFLTQDMADVLSLKPHHKEDISLSSFGSKHSLNKKMGVGQIYVKTKSGELLPIMVLIVPTIATPLRNTMKTNITQLPHLRGLPLGHLS